MLQQSSQSATASDASHISNAYFNTNDTDEDYNLQHSSQSATAADSNHFSNAYCTTYDTENDNILQQSSQSAAASDLTYLTTTNANVKQVPAINQSYDDVSDNPVEIYRELSSLSLSGEEKRVPCSPPKLSQPTVTSALSPTDSSLFNMEVAELLPIQSGLTSIADASFNNYVELGNLDESILYDLFDNSKDMELTEENTETEDHSPAKRPKLDFTADRGKSVSKPNMNELITFDTSDEDPATIEANAFAKEQSFSKHKNYEANNFAEDQSFSKQINWEANNVAEDLSFSKQSLSQEINWDLSFGSVFKTNTEDQFNLKAVNNGQVSDINTSDGFMFGINSNDVTTKLDFNLGVSKIFSLLVIEEVYVFCFM